VATLSLPVVTVIRENVAVLMTFAFSRKPLEDWAKVTLEGEFKRLRETLFEIPAQRAERAVLELALLFRYLDDESNISSYYREGSSIGFGYVEDLDGVVTDLSLREVTNKIIHAVGFEWDFSKASRPLLVCHPRDKQRWKRASVDIASVAAISGQLLG
jgi:hypothetical protein